MLAPSSYLPEDQEEEEEDPEDEEEKKEPLLLLVKVKAMVLVLRAATAVPVQKTLTNVKAVNSIKTRNITRKRGGDKGKKLRKISAAAANSLAIRWNIAAKKRNPTGAHVLALLVNNDIYIIGKCKDKRTKLTCAASVRR